MPLQIGQKLADKYTIIKEIGQGGFGRVYLAEEDITHAKVAIKALRMDLPDERMQEARERFDREIRIGRHLKSDHTVTMHTFARKDNNIYLVLEYMPGGSLADLLEPIKSGEKPPLPIEDAIRMTREVCRALDDLHNHAMEFIHRDVTPYNILLDEKGHAKLMDFGLVQEPGGSSGRSRGLGGEHPGHSSYKSPEAENTRRHLTPPSDIYMLGAVLFELLTGRLYKNRPDTPSGELRSDVPPELDAVVLKAVAENPKERYQSAIKFDAALEQIERQLHPRELDDKPALADQTPIVTATHLPSPIEPTHLTDNEQTDVASKELKSSITSTETPSLLSNLSDKIKIAIALLGIVSIIILGIIFFATRSYTPSIVSSSSNAISADNSLSVTLEPTTPKPTITKSLTPTPTIQKTSTPKPTATKTKTPKPTATPIPFLSINTETMNIRSGPGTDYDIVDKAKQDETFTVAAQTDDGDWYRLSGSDEQWVSADFVQITGSPPVTQDIPPTPPPINPAFLPYGEFETIWNNFGGRTGSLGNPISSVTTNVECTREKFERGIAVWLRPINLPLGTGYFGVYGAQSYIVPDTWQEGMASRTCNLTSAVRGFNKTLCEHSQIRIALGDPIEAESGNSDAIIQEFQKGIIIYSPIDQKIMVFFNNNTWQDNL